MKQLKRFFEALWLLLPNIRMRRVIKDLLEIYGAKEKKRLGLLKFLISKRRHILYKYRLLYGKSYKGRLFRQIRRIAEV